MTRPIYETQTDIQKERAVADWMEARGNATYTKTKSMYPIDFAIECEDSIIGLAEIKCRNYTMQTLDGWGGFFISAKKWADARLLTGVLGISFSVVVADSAGDVWQHVPYGEWEHDGLAMKGTTRRNDPNDMEPCVLLRACRFSKLGTMP